MPFLPHPPVAGVHTWYAIDGFCTCDDVRATEWTASVHTLHMPKPSLSGHVCHCSTCTGWYSGTVVSTSIGSPWSVKLRANSASAEHIFLMLSGNASLRRAKPSGNDHGTKLHGAIEGDGHAVRKIYVGHENKHFVSEVQAAHQNWRKKHGCKRLPKYWVGHVRLAALKQRNGPVVVCPLPLKLHTPGTAPGTESLQDLRSTNLDKHLTNKASTQLHSDGAKSGRSGFQTRSQRCKNFM